MRNRTGFTARFVPVDRTSTEPNQAEGPVRFLSWVGQAHQFSGDGVPCPTPSQWSGTGGEEEGAQVPPKAVADSSARDRKIMRLNLAFGEVCFSFYCSNKYLASVVNENLGNWLGFESMIEQKEEV